MNSKEDWIARIGKKLEQLDEEALKQIDYDVALITAYTSRQEAMKDGQPTVDDRAGSATA